MFPVLLCLILLKLSALTYVPQKRLLEKLNPTADFKPIINLTSKLIVALKIENFITYSNSRHKYNGPTLEQALAEYFQMPTIVWGGFDIFDARHIKIVGRNTLAFVQITEIGDSLLKEVDTTLRDLHSIPMIFMLELKSDHAPTLLEIERLFDWCWQEYLTNVLLMVRLENGDKLIYQFYKFTPFPKINVKNVTSLGLMEQANFVASNKLRVHGYKFFTPIYNMPPYMLMLSDVETCRKQGSCSQALSGIGGRFYREYMHQINGSIDVALFNKSFFTVQKEMASVLSNKTIHISAMPTSDMYVASVLTFDSYPIWHVNTCIMVPHVPEIFYGDYVKRTFEANVWLLVFVLFAALIIFQAISNLCAALPSQLSVEDPLSYAIGRLTSQPISRAALNAHGKLYKFCQLLILLMCFVLINMYTTTITSLLSTTLFDAQINTLQKFLNSNLTLGVSLDQKATLFDTGRLPQQLISKIKILDWPTIYKYRKDMRTNFAYTVSSDFWNFINMQQKRLRKPVFRIAGKELCTQEFFVKLSLRADSPFLTSLTLFTMYALEGGLAIKWNDMSIMDSVRSNYLKTFQHETPLWKSLSLEHYTLAFGVCLLFLVCSITAFLAELFFHAWSKKRMEQIRWNKVSRKLRRNKKK